MTCLTYQRSCGTATEFYLTATPTPGSAVFAEVADTLRRNQACILQERIFAQTDEVGALARERSAAYGNLDDGIAPTWLASPQGRGGPLAAIQVHAITGTKAPTLVGGHARILHHPGASLVTVSAITAPQAGDVPEQCAAVFNEIGSLLERTGTAMNRIARTWLWMDPIYSWYRDLNRTRNLCFLKQGLIAADGKPVHLPASTGIGLRPAIRGDISLEAMVAIDGPAPVMLAAGGNQNCALGYGSAFSRAAKLLTPSGDTYYVSGTAAIDATGKTVFLGDGPRQIVNTVDNVRAVLRDLKVTEQDIVQGVAYCLTPEVAAEWQRLTPGWPLAVVLADICRDDLLFEIELTACPGARR